MKKLLVFIGLILTHAARAVDVAYAPPVGGMTIPAAANTDAFVSVALATNAAWVGKVVNVSGSDITVSSTPIWSANAFVSSGYHYARMLSGAQKGHYFSIIANSANTLSVDPAGLNLGALTAGDTLEIAPYWTLGTLYPGAKAGASFISSASPLARQTEILFYDADATGINRSASATYYYYGGAWRKTGASTSNSYDNTIIYPDSYFIQRNKAATTALVYVGRVQPASVGTVLVAVASTQNDNYVALAYPVGVTLNASGLASSSFTASPSPLSIKDQLLWFDPAGTGTNRSASATYYYYNSGWRKIGASAATDFGASVILTAGNGFVIRKAANSTTAPWVFDTGF